MHRLIKIARRARSTLDKGPKSAAKGTAKVTESTIPLVPTIAAMTASIATVTLATFVAEKITASDCPKFDSKATRFDQSTFVGRFTERLLACDPKLLTYSSEEVAHAKSLVDNAANVIANPPEGVSNIHHTLWESKRISDATLHPDSGEAIPSPFRMSGYVPFNGPICVSMVLAQTTPQLLLVNWVNQSHNALVNYFNRNASSELSNETLAKSYAVAVGSSLLVAFGLATYIKKSYDPVTASRLMRFVAFPSSVAASSLNCYIVRSPEIDTGIPLMDKDGKVVLEGETSVVAAKTGVYSTTASRAILQAPVYFLPPALMAALPLFKRIVAKNPAISVPLTTYLIIVCFGIGLPATTAIFPQISEISAKDAEKKYQNLKDINGAPIEKFYFNKGL